MDIVGLWRTAVRDLKYALRTLRRTPGLHNCCRADAGAGDWREHRDLHAPRPGSAAPAARQRPAQPRTADHARPPLRQQLGLQRDFLPDVQGFSGAQRGLLRDVRALSDVRQRDHRQTSRSASRRELVSGTYFDILGVGTAIGRTFTADDDRTPHGHPLVILSYNFWKQRLGGNPDVIGSTLLVNNQKMTVVGVAQAGFDGVELGDPPSIFVPMMMQVELMPGNLDMLTNRRNRWVNAFGRLKSGVTPAQAKASLQPFMHSMLEMEVKEAAFNHASAYDREQFLKCWMDVLPGLAGPASRSHATCPHLCGC